MVGTTISETKTRRSAIKLIQRQSDYAVEAPDRTIICDTQPQAQIQYEKQKKRFQHKETESHNFKALM